MSEIDAVINELIHFIRRAAERNVIPDFYLQTQWRGGELVVNNADLYVPRQKELPPTFIVRHNGLLIGGPHVYSYSPC